MSLPDRIKAVSIENKWFATMVQHMSQKFKYDSKIRFQLKIDEVTSEEYCIQQLLNPSQSPYTSDMSLENFFNFKNDRYISEDKGINESLFLKHLRYFSLREQNDTLTLSSEMLESEEILNFYLDAFSNSKAFENYCT
jgi:hypothetical protein